MGSVIYRGIQQTKDTCSGRARIKGRRVDVVSVLMHLQNGVALSAIAEQFQLTEEQVQDAVGYAIKCVERFDPPKKP